MRHRVTATAYFYGTKGISLLRFDTADVFSAVGLFTYVMDCLDSERVLQYDSPFRIRLHTVGYRIPIAHSEGLWLRSAIQSGDSPEHVEERCADLWERFFAR